MNKYKLIGPIIIASSIILATTAYLYFNPQAECKRDFMNHFLKDKNINENSLTRYKLEAHSFCLGKK